MTALAHGEIQPVFDPEKPGLSMDLLHSAIPVRTHRLAGPQVGDTVSTTIGQGTEIDGTRPYLPGDDPRHIDWYASARQTDGSLVVRQHYDDITPRLWIATDMFQPRHRANAGHFSEEALAASAIFALTGLANRQGMVSALVSVHEGVGHSAKPGKGRSHLRQTGQMLAALMNNAPENPAPERPLSDALHEVARKATRHSVIVVSDFRDGFMPDESQARWKRPLQQLVKEGNDVTAIELTNPWDFQLPEESDRFGIGSWGFSIAGKKAQEYRERRQELAQDQQQTIDEAIQAAGVLHIKLSTADGTWLHSLRKLLSGGRRNRRA